MPPAGRTVLFGALTRRVGGVAVAQAATVAGAIFTDMLLAWTLDRQTNGYLQSALIVTRMSVLAGALGIPTSLYFLFPRTEAGEKRPLAGQSFFILVVTGWVLGVGIWLGAPWLAVLLGQPAEVVPMMRLAGLAAMLGIPAVLAEPLLVLLDRPWLAAGNAAAGAFVQAGLVAWILSTGQGAERVLPALAAASAGRLLLPCLLALRKLPAGAGAHRTVSWPLLKVQAAVAIPVAATAAIDAVSVYIDRLVVARFFSSADLALYRYGAQEVPFIGLVTGALTPVLLPQFSALLQQGKGREVLALWHRAAAKVAMVLFGAFWLFLWTAPEFLVLLYSPRYRDAALFFRIYLLLLPFRVVAFMPILYALGQGRLVAVVAAGEVVLNGLLAGMFITVFRAGMAGAAWATVVATAAQAAIYLWAIRRGLGCRWSEILPWKELLRTLAVAGLFFLPVALGRLAGPSPVLLVLAAAGCAVAYGWWRVFPRLRAEPGKTGMR